MNLEKKKILAAKTLNVGKGRIVLNQNSLAEIKEAITRQDIKDLFANGAITIKEIKGRKTRIKRNTRRRFGSIRKKRKNSKQRYVILTRKLRRYLGELRSQDKLPEERYQKMRKEIKAGVFKSKSHIKENISPKKK